LIDTEADLITVQKLWMQREVLVKEASNLCLYINATQLLDVGAIVSISSAVEEQPVVSLQPAVLETVINERLPQLLCLRALKSEPASSGVALRQGGLRFGVLSSLAFAGIRLEVQSALREGDRLVDLIPWR
jgi:hypothetical protein